MKTYKCEFTNGSRSEKIQANSYRDAYDKFLAKQGPIQIPVIVLSGFMDTGEIFKDHIEKAPDKTARMEAADAKRQEMHTAATEDAQASLTSTDILLKQQIAKLEEIRVIAVWFWWWFIGASLIGFVLFLLLLTGALVGGGSR